MPNPTSVYATQAFKQYEILHGHSPIKILLYFISKPYSEIKHFQKSSKKRCNRFKIKSLPMPYANLQQQQIVIT